MGCGKTVPKFAAGTWVCPPCFAKRDRKAMKDKKFNCVKCGQETYGKMTCPQCFKSKGDEKPIYAFTSKGNDGVGRK
jgi:hypothetical protein